VAAGEHRPGLGDLVQGTCDNAVQLFRRKFPRGEADKVQAGDWASAHGINVTDGVCRGDLAVGEWVVDRGRDVVSSGDDGNLLGKLVDTGIVAGVKTNEQVGVLVLWKAFQEFTEPDRVDFCGSSAGLGKALQGRFIEHCHVY
jgi:hypothetical protein